MNTNYIPLYRKYRPQMLEQIVGQEHIKRALTNAIQMDMVSHAYLFTGPRGTGKTSTARIFAKSLNCEHGPTITPCNECENCKNITNSVPIDVIEIDAASNRSVSDADDIVQKVALAPVQSRYKIYIIDEVHMLSKQAFNALLKTLEEPPKNVIFILATTEVHQVLDTIKSRCQRFDFKRITTEDIVKHLRYIADSEKINITEDSLYYIAQNSAGGMRDSIALLDQLSILNSAQSPISVNDISNLLGRLSFDALTTLFEAIISSNQNLALSTLNDIYNQGNEPVQILSNLLEYYRNALIIKSVESINSSMIQLNNDQVSILSAKLQNIEVHQIVSLIDMCSQYIKELKITSNPKLWLDVAILDMSNLTENTKLYDLQKRIVTLESGVGVQRLVNSSPYNTPPQPVNKVVGNQQSKQNTKIGKGVEEEISQTSTEEEVLTDTVPMSKIAQKSSLKQNWIALLEHISSFPSRAILKQQAIPVKITQEEVIISIKNQSWLKQFAQDGSKHYFIVDAANALFSSPVKKVIVRTPEDNDENIRKEQDSSDELTPEPVKISNETQEKNNLPSSQEVIEALDSAENMALQSSSSNFEVSHKAKNADDFNHSDDVNMVINLFEGKIIE